MLTIEEYEAKREARYQRLINAAERAQREGEAAQNQARAIAKPGDTILYMGYLETL